MIRDTAAQNATLDALLGDARAAGVPASFSLALFDGDPMGDGVETDAPRVTVPNTTAVWDGASNGEKTSTPVTLAGTGTYATAATHWCLFDGTTGWFTGELDEAVSEPTDTAELAVFIGDGE